MGGELPPPLRRSAADRRTWRSRRQEWRRRTRLGVLCVLTAVAAVLAWRGIAPRQALGWTTVAVGDIAERAHGLFQEALDADTGTVVPGAAAASVPQVATLEVSTRTVPPPIARAPAAGGPVGGTLVSPVWPTPINLADPTDPEVPGDFRRLTEGGCCAGAWWSSDGTRAYFLVRAEGAPSASIYQTDLWPPGVAPKPANMELARGAGAARYTVSPWADHSVVKDHDTGITWEVPTGGSPGHVAGDGASVVWWKARGDRGHFDAAVTVYASGPGEAPRELVTLWGATVVGYLAGEQRILVTGRPVQDRSDFVLATVDAMTGELGQLAKGTWLSDAIPSPTGEWVVYMVSLNTEDPAANGQWLVGTDNQPPRRLPFIGSYRWRDGSTLVYVPQIADAASDEIWALDAPTLRTERLIDPVAVPLRIANNDWSVAPGGRHLLFRSASDLNLWLVRLP